MILGRRRICIAFVALLQQCMQNKERLVSAGKRCYRVVDNCSRISLGWRFSSDKSHLGEPVMMPTMIGDKLVPVLSLVMKPWWMAGAIGKRLLYEACLSTTRVELMCAPKPTNKVPGSRRETGKGDDRKCNPT